LDSHIWNAVWKTTGVVTENVFARTSRLIFADFTLNVFHLECGDLGSVGVGIKEVTIFQEVGPERQC
jgi:hypothetical protein